MKCQINVIYETNVWRCSSCSIILLYFKSYVHNFISNLRINSRFNFINTIIWSCQATVSTTIFNIFLQKYNSIIGHRGISKLQSHKSFCLVTCRGILVGAKTIQFFSEYVWAQRRWKCWTLKTVTAQTNCFTQKICNYNIALLCFNFNLILLSFNSLF